LIERVDAFRRVFGRLQDTIGDKLLPAFLSAMAETPGTALENLERAEKVDLIQSEEIWKAMRKMRNRLTHEYVVEAGELLSALVAAHENIGTLADALKNISDRLFSVFPELASLNSSAPAAAGHQS
jgi:uncharacterized protein YutE (UPF0331/DUF86 family)